MAQEKTEKSNYEKVFEQFKIWFLEDDTAKTSKKLGLREDSSFLYVPFFDKLCLVDKKSGEITAEDGEELSVTDRLTIMQHLHYYQDYALESDKMVPFREIREACIFERAYEKSALQPLMRGFSGHGDKLLEAGLKLGGRQENFGDVSVTLYAFPKIKLTYIFWEADDEFPASANILFDNRITQWTHGESVPVLAETGTRKLLEAAGIKAVLH